MPGAAWDDIRIFLAIAETGSLSAAAVALGSSQATVGRRLRALERSLGLRLAERVSNRIVLTEALPDTDQLWLRDEHGRPHVSELLIELYDTGRDRHVR